MQKNSPNQVKWLWVVVIFTIVLVVYSNIYTPITDSKLRVSPGTNSPLLTTMDNLHVIKAGYGVYPPFTYEDPNTGKVSGIAIDIINEIAKQSGVEVEWKRFNWNTMAADLKRGDYDVLADAIFETPERARELTFTQPYAYLPIGVGVVKIDEARFKKFEDLDLNSIQVAVGQGFAEETFVKARLHNAKIISIPSGQDTSMAINSVLTGRADIAITNLENAERFVAAHPTTLKILWANNPPAYVPAGFALSLGDQLGADFLNVSLNNFKATGILSSIVDKSGKAIAIDLTKINR